MTSSEKRMLLPILRKLANHEKLNHRAQSAAEQLYARLTRPSLKSKSGRLRREQQRATHKEETAKIRGACMERANSQCEARPWRGGGHGWPDVMDHWEGGSGRRREKQSVDTCWMLCVFCDGERTKNYPSAAYWNEIRRAHCSHYGYPFTPHIIHAEPAKAGGAP